MKRLYIVRHGVPQSVYEAGNDFARKLTPAGCEGVRAVAERIAGESGTVLPERIVASAAPRALRTAEILAERFGDAVGGFSVVRELYSGRANDYLDVLVRSLPDEVGCAMVVGHNPAVSELLAVLTGAMAGEYAMRKGDTACVAFDLPSGAPWEELYVSEGRLERYVIASGC